MLFIAFSLFAILAQTSPISDDLSARVQRVVEIFDNGRKSLGVPGMAVGFVGGPTIDKERPVWIKGFGHRSYVTKEPFTENTLFGIASNSKLMTGHVLALLAEEGKLDLNTPINRYINVSFTDEELNDEINLIDLVSHRTGIPNRFHFYSLDIPMSELISEFEQTKPVGKFRESFYYNNYAFELAGVIANRVLQLPSDDGFDPFYTWRELMKHRIFDALNMSSTTVSFVQYMTDKDIAFSHSVFAKDDGSNDWLVSQHKQSSREYILKTVGPAAGVFTCMKDFTKWLSYQLDMAAGTAEQLIVSKESHNVIFSNHNKYSSNDGMSYGLGVRIQNHRGVRMYWHTGVLPEHNTLTCIFPDNGMAISFFLNSLVPDEFLESCSRIVDVLIFGDSAESFNQTVSSIVNSVIHNKKAIATKNNEYQQNNKQNSKLSLSADEYAGVFHFTEIPDVQFESKIISDSPLTLQFSPLNSYPTAVMADSNFILQHWSEDTFVSVIEGQKFFNSGLFSFNIDSGIVKNVSLIHVI